MKPRELLRPRFEIGRTYDLVNARGQMFLHWSDYRVTTLRPERLRDFIMRELHHAIERDRILL